MPGDAASPHPTTLFEDPSRHVGCTMAIIVDPTTFLRKPIVLGTMVIIVVPRVPVTVIMPKGGMPVGNLAVLPACVRARAATTWQAKQRSEMRCSPLA